MAYIINTYWMTVGKVMIFCAVAYARLALWYLSELKVIDI